MSKPLLYSYFRSSCSWRVRIALSYKQILYDIKPVNLIKDGGEQNSDEYRKLNPMGQVPVLNIDGITLSQSMSIMEYLEEKYPKIPLLPKESADRAKVRAIAETITSGIQPLQNNSVIRSLPKDDQESWTQNVIHKGLVALEKMLSSTAGKYCYGDDITIADCCLVPQIYNARRYKVDLTSFPVIRRIDATLLQIEAFRSTHPSNQIDCPPSAKVPI